MRLILTALSLLVALSFSAPAFANCGPAFYGFWRQGSGPISGQYTRMDFLAQKSFVFLTTRTATNSSFTHRSLIYDATYNEHSRQISAKSTGANTCSIKFLGKPDIDKDPYGAYRKYAVSAKLTVKGRSMRWCWSRSGHHGGDCVNFRRLQTLEQIGK